MRLCKQLAAEFGLTVPKICKACQNSLKIENRISYRIIDSFDKIFNDKRHLQREKTTTKVYLVHWFSGHDHPYDHSLMILLEKQIIDLER